MNEASLASAFDIVGIGMSTLDFLQLVPDFPSETGITETLGSVLMGGGPVPTALCAAAKLGSRTAIIDRMGEDWRGRLVAEDYSRHGVVVEYLQMEKGKTSTFSTVLVRERDGERHCIFSPGNFTPLTIEEMPQVPLLSCKVLHLNGRHWPACLSGAKVAREAGARISFDGGAGRYDPKFKELLALTDIAVVARDFGEHLSHSSETAEQLVALLQFGVQIAGITDGERGSWFATAQGDTFHQPAFAMKSVVDTTGCGDAFHGGFLHAFCCGWELRESALFATAVAAANTLKLGGRGNLPDLAAVQDIIKQASYFRNF